VGRRKPYDWAADEVRDALKLQGPEAVTALVRDLLERARNFVRALADAGVHVGVGSPPTCATCDTPWPCSHARDR
jgi:hypothetical protein